VNVQLVDGEVCRKVSVEIEMAEVRTIVLLMLGVDGFGKTSILSKHFITPVSVVLE